MTHRPSDSLSLTWIDAPAPVSRPATARISQPKIDPASMPSAGSRVGNPHDPRGVAIIGQPSNAPYRETAKHALFGGGPERAPNTPLRGIGGNTSMSGILSTPTGVPLQDLAPRSSGKAGLGFNNKSTLELSDSVPAAGFSTSRTHSQGTRSSITMSSDIDDTPLHTGKGGFNQNQRKSTLQLGSMEGEPTPQKRPNTAATNYKNRSSIQLGDDSAQEPRAAGVSRPQTTSRNSDIFFVNQEDTAPARSHGKAHVTPAFSSQESDGLPNLGMHTSRKNQESAGLLLGSTVPAAALQPTQPYHGAASAASHVDGDLSLLPEGYNAPPSAAGSLIPQLRLPGSGTATASMPVAGVSTRERVPEDPKGGFGPSTRRAYGNAKNASTLFQSESMANLQPKPAPKQVPDLPPPQKAHIKFVRQDGNKNSVKNLLVWE